MYTFPCAMTWRQHDGYYCVEYVLTHWDYASMIYTCNLTNIIYMLLHRSDRGSSTEISTQNHLHWLTGVDFSSVFNKPVAFAMYLLCIRQVFVPAPSRRVNGICINHCASVCVKHFAVKLQTTREMADARPESFDCGFLNESTPGFGAAGAHLTRFACE